ncbi:MaoC/PaaZ C-terminal domain-containing protein [Phreatobacter oligotrophus]|uniref:Acyl dehydratase n=1 Tax=Phreatobacter oligotrophus TaxID=1122261 RepID=A0A2T4ZF40_9HYPH|nr:MaoC/PaaZ C-terminal domain-containing protein [Phreatobacter oligotrophus]PTM60507.1 acyl dehydratase [Phreatobacter oligotrophus]
MPIDYAKLKAWPFPDLEHSYTAKDTILYALGVGCGADPVDRSELPFVYEDGLKALPTMAVVLGYPGFWLKDPNTGVDWRKVLHGEQGLLIHKPLPATGTVIGRTRVTEIIDKGPGKGALLLSERDVIDKASGDLLATLTSTTFIRGEGGFGGPSGPSPEPHPLPERAPDLAVDLPTLPQAALIYRLSGDYNPLHADPDVATGAGFPRPILHGLCTYAVAGRAILKACCDNDPARLTRLDLRFSAPVLPGETVRTEIWRDGSAVSFRARVVERDVVVLNNGRATVA